MISGAGAGSPIFGTCGFKRGVAEDEPEAGDEAPESGDTAPEACGGRGADFTGALAELPVVFVAEGLEVTGLTLDAPAVGWVETGGFDVEIGGFDVEIGGFDGATAVCDGATGDFHGVITGRFAGLKGPLSSRLPGAAAPFNVDVLTGGTDIFAGIRVEIGGATGGGDIGATVFGANADDCLETLFD